MILSGMTERHTTLSGVEVNQNLPPVASVVPAALTYQTFHLPQDFRRGEYLPDLTGLQVCATVEDADAFTLEYVLQVDTFGEWEDVTSGTVTGAHAEGDYIWIDLYFDESVPMRDEWAPRQFRIGLLSPSPVWYHTPNAFANETGPVADSSLLFRVLTASADSGVDFLGNTYRSVVARSAAQATNTVGVSDVNQFWMSKPNPSRFAVESLYFDVRNDLGHATVIDRVLIDPITPGVYCTLYYSSEDEPGANESEWEAKVWTPTYKLLRLDRRQEHVLSDPLTAKYIKVEFTHLQAQHYQAGTFHQPIRYKKHPKWVLDYFMARLETNTDDNGLNAPRNIRVVYDRIDLAYKYYLDDLRPDPSLPINVGAFLEKRTDKSDQVDAETLQRINLEMKPYTRPPANRVGSLDNLLALTMSSNVERSPYPVENVQPARVNVTEVSPEDRSSLVVDATLPVMYFFVTAPHIYRELEAPFEDDKGYFVGVRELAFTRDHYTVASDTPLYIDTLTDFTNVVRNDFIEQDYLPFNPNPAP